MRSIKTKFYNEKKRKYAAMSSVLTAVLLAVVIVLNIAVTALCDHYRLYFDMTEGQVFSLCDATKELMADVDADINIYFATEEDKISEQSIYLYYVYQTAMQMQAEFDNVHVKCVDIIKNPGFFKSYYTTAAQDIYTTSVIVESGSEFRLYAIEAFFVNNEEGKIWAYEGEYKLVSAVLSLTAAESPIACFTTAHGEKTGQSALETVKLFEDGGFDVREIDLSKEDIPENTRIVIINDPVYDFAGIEAGDNNEIDKLDAFADGFGTLMVFTSPSHAGKLTNLSEFLAEWGIGFTPDTYIKDTENSVDVYGKVVLANYEKDTPGASLYSDISKLGEMPKTVFRDAMPLKILEAKQENLSGAREVSAIFTAHDSAVAVHDGEETNADGAPLMTISTETVVRNNDYYNTYVIVSGSSDYLNDVYLRSDAYANSDVLYNTMRITGRDKILADIDIKVLDNTELVVSTLDANKWTVALTVTLPAILAVIGICVFVRRKNS